MHVKKKIESATLCLLCARFCCLASAVEFFALGSKWAKFLQDKNAQTFNQRTHAKNTPLAKFSFSVGREQRRAKCGGKI
jgi:hypothetical protein